MSNARDAQRNSSYQASDMKTSQDLSEPKHQTALVRKMLSVNRVALSRVLSVV
jgi:hypothetical protein